METIPRYNVAIIGHIANGKSTLIETLTGTSTKRHSVEKTEGATRKLGYAFCYLYQCEKCMRYASCRDVKYTCCNEPAKCLEQIYFIDTPGHHKYIETMNRGIVCADIALLLTDCKSETLQKQTLEHLIIATIYNVKTIVLQNKIELVTTDQCRKHYAMLVSEMKGTTAEGAPIIPISAQNGVNIDIVCKVLHQSLQTLIKPIVQKTTMKVVRSFDINKAWEECNSKNWVMDLKGGIMGVSVCGSGSFKVDDIITILPGVVKRDGTTIPLKTKIIGIRSEEKEENKPITQGGTFSLGTLLDPSLTKDDRLIGNLAGFEGEMPAVINVLNGKITEMRGCSLRNGAEYEVIIGNVYSVALSKEITPKQGKKRAVYEFKLKRPICTTEDKFLIYTKRTRTESSRLIGFGTRSTEPIRPHEYVAIDYGAVLKAKITITRVCYTLPIPSLERQNRDCIWKNFIDFCQDIHREEKQVIAYIKEEYAINISVCKDGLRMNRFRKDENKIEKLMKTFIVKFVRCRQCGSIDTTTEKCSTCGAFLRLDVSE